MTSQLDIAIVIFRLEPAGGLEIHALRLAEDLVARGHRVTIVTTRATQAPSGIDLLRVTQRGFTNHGRIAAFAMDMARETAGKFDLAVGFQRMPGLDVLFCGDWCFADRNRQWWKTLSPRARTLTSLEKACFRRGSDTLLLMLAEPQAEAYRRSYDTEQERMIILPPTLDQNLIPQDLDAAERATLRTKLGYHAEETVWLWLGLHPHTKGLDRAVEALALSPAARLVACGPDPEGRKIQNIRKQAQALGCAGRLTLHGLTKGDALKDRLRAADLLMHPARLDVTGMVIAEALAAGLPVIATANCGFAPLVEEAAAGIVVSSEASPRELAEAGSADKATLTRWSQSAQDYVTRTDLSTGMAVAVEAIETRAHQKRSHP
ncbi:glycosyltransferase family 4 protein [Rhizobium sp. EC-SD404]|uniref:glycosyltransferase family 4 protein n=1 Tax=Rhizobium sp. EC-SD404 TaxID=2038389 RepID=UPI001259C34D|nr:glycosyltransferase family 4 protein [Rhizobium sp. EC-SD404]VVT25676.1 Glycosyl transferase family 1 [Rhizobium sp. EC-SD404]